jgi:hypothetical protein
MTTAITKKILLTFILPTLIVTLTMYGMETKKVPRLIDVIQNPLIYNNTSITLSGIIQLRKNAIVGYGSKDCIKALKETNINTKQQWPLVPVNILIPIPKKTAHCKQTYTNWTQQTPSIIKETINNLIDTQIHKEEKKIASLYGSTITPQNQKIWENFYTLSEKIKVCASKAKLPILLALIPAHILLARTIQINFFNCYPTTLTFDQHQKLEELIEKFYIAPQATFTIFDLETTSSINYLQLLEEKNLPINAKLKVETYKKVSTQISTTHDQLEEKNIIINTALLNQNDCDCTIPRIGIMTIKQSHLHGDNGCTRNTLRNLLLNNELNNHNPLTFINNRAMTSKNNHYKQRIFS